MSVELRPLPSEPRAAALARSYVVDTCRDLPRPTLEVALLLTSELVTNAVQHGTPDITMRIDCADTQLCVEVEDAGAELPAPRTAPATADRGRGLMLVQAYADSWGVRRIDGGKCVWFRMSTPPHDTSSSM